MDDLRAVEAELEDEDDNAPLTEFVEALRTPDDDALRLVVRHGAEGQEVLYVRDDVAADHDGASLERRVDRLTFAALGDPRESDDLADFGRLNATLRWFDNAVMAVFPTGEWSGVVATFDRRESPLVDAALEHLQ